MKQPWAVLHLEMESSGHLGIPEELLRYNVMARHATQLPVHSVVMLLRPKATATDLTGLLELPDSLGQTYLTFRYTVIRLWQEPFDGLLNAGVGIAPLALLTNEAAVDLAVAGVRFRQWVQKSNLPNHIARQLLGTAGILCGLRYNADEVLEVTMGGRNILDDSSVAQEFMRRGRAEALQNTLIVLGSDLFGQPTQELKARIQAIPDVARLERMTRKIITLKTWDELTTIQ